MFNISVFIGGIKGEDQSVIQAQNPQLSGETHNRTRLLSCTTVSWNFLCIHTSIQTQADFLSAVGSVSDCCS